MNVSADRTDVKKKTLSPSVNSVAKKTGARSPLTKLPANPVQQKKTPVNLATRTIPNKDGQTEEKSVEKILAKRFNPRQRYHEYLVKWEKLESDQNTWEPHTHFSTSRKMVDTFEVQLARQKEVRAAAIAKAEADAAAAVEKEKEMRKASLNQNPDNESTSPQRLSRNSKLKALDQVKKWLTGTDVPQANEAKKRKTDDSDYEGENDAVSARVDTGDAPPAKIFKRESASSVITQAIKNAGISGSINSYPVSQVAINVKNNGPTKLSAEATSVTNSGIVKRSGITINSIQKQQPAKASYVTKTENGIGCVVRSNATSMPIKAAAKISLRSSLSPKGALIPTGRPSGITLKSVASTTSTTGSVTSKPVVITKKSIIGTQKPSGVSTSQVSPVCVLNCTTVMKITHKFQDPRASSTASPNLLGNTIITRVPKGLANKPSPTQENKLASLQRQSGLKITRKIPSGSVRSVEIQIP